MFDRVINEVLWRQAKAFEWAGLRLEQLANQMKDEDKKQSRLLHAMGTFACVMGEALRKTVNE